MTTGNNQLSGWTEKKLQSTSQSQTCTKKGHGHCLVACCGLIHYSFLNPSETITSEMYAQQINEMHPNCNACSWHWSTEWAQFFSMTTSDGLLHNNASKVKRIGLQSFASSAIFT